MPKRVWLALLAIWFVSCQWWALTINVRFDQAPGLAPESRVLFEGQTAGVVEAIESHPEGGLSVRVKIDKQFAHAATEYSRFYLVVDPDRSDRKAIDIRLSRPDGQTLADGATVSGISQSHSWAERLRRDFEDGVRIFKKHFEDMERDLRRIPESEEYKRFSESLKGLADELGRSEEQARRKLKEEWLPRLEQELERLKRKLHDANREKELRELEEQVERIRRI